MAKRVNRKILISGTSSGLGKFLHKRFNCIKYDRQKKYEYYSKKNWNIIIHCGFYTGNDINKINESIEHSFLISKLKSKKYIFISSTVVYEGSKEIKEKANLLINKKSSLYSKSKIICESFFDNNKTLILRLGTLVGPYMRKNTIYKILFQENPKINLSKTSLYSFVSYEEVFQFINLSIDKNINGIFNFLRTDYKNLEYITKYFNKNTTFGKFVFQCTKADNKKIQKKVDLTNFNSIDTLISLKNNHAN